MLTTLPDEIGFTPSGIDPSPPADRKPTLPMASDQTKGKKPSVLSPAVVVGERMEWASGPGFWQDLENLLRQTQVVLGCDLDIQG